MILLKFAALLRPSFLSYIHFSVFFLESPGPGTRVDCWGPKAQQHCPYQWRVYAHQHHALQSSASLSDLTNPFHCCLILLTPGWVWAEGRFCSASRWGRVLPPSCALVFRA